MFSFFRNIVFFMKNVQNSLFMWFLLTYGSMYVIGVFTVKNIYSKFEEDFSESIALQTLENRTKNISFVKNFFQLQNIYDLSHYIYQYNESGISIHSVVVPVNSPTLILDNGAIWKDVNWDRIKACAENSLKCKNPLMRAYNLGLKPPFENYFITAAFVEINHKRFFNINMTRPSSIYLRHISNIKKTEHLSQALILISFICYIFISYGAVRPINLFIKNMQERKLISDNFIKSEPGELNHVKYIRQTIYNALVQNEQQEKERLFMQNALLAQQKEAEIGKIVSQISHDLKSPLVIFEEILRENSHENFSKNYDAAKKALNKIMSLVQSLKQADKESLVQRVLAPFSVELVLQECRAYAKAKGLHVDFYISDSNPLLLLDHAKVERSLNNLLRNAVEYAKSKVILKIRLVESDLHIYVQDDGVGVSPEILPKLFQWRQTGNQDTGTGIGLYYARQVARGHGGDLSYQHEQGLTSFIMVLPGVKQSTNLMNSALHSDTVNRENQGALTSVAGKLCLESDQVPKKYICFYLKNPEAFEVFQKYFAEFSLPCLFFFFFPAQWDVHDLRLLYTDNSDDVFIKAVDAEIPVILHREGNTPAQLNLRLTPS